MGFNFRKSIKILPGVRLNINKRGFSLSFKRLFGTTNVTSKGKVSHTLKTPIKGLTYRKR